MSSPPPAARQIAVALLAEGVDRNFFVPICFQLHPVALLAEGVDRNLDALRRLSRCLVALLAEGVDRNMLSWIAPSMLFQVALLAEGVDRNSNGLRYPCDPEGSPSSRRAWIEIKLPLLVPQHAFVALLAEGVDRNNLPLVALHSHQASPSSRRAWIEISSVIVFLGEVSGRPPRGGRG